MKNFLKKIASPFLPDNGIFLYPFFQLDAKIFPKIFYFKRMYEKIEKIDGDIVECGIGYSRTFQALSLLAYTEAEGGLKDRSVWGFDSFEGFPEPTLEDQSLRNPKKGEWKVMTVSQLNKILHIIRIPDQFIRQHIYIIKGFFEDTVPESGISRIALLHLDVDLYASYKTCLEHLFSKVVPGGIVLFDEYGSTESFPGAKKAINEYFEGLGQVISKDPSTGKYFLVKR